MQQPNKGIISPGLKGLMLVQEGLRQLKEGQVSSQGPAGPTLAMQMAQAAQQPQQQPSMMPPPPGQAQPQQNPTADVAQDAGIGAAIQSQQQQQAQQAMMQMAQQQQQAQQQPAMMASGGIAALRADNLRHFKEGGVLGFATEPSLVPSVLGSRENYEKGNVKNAEEDKILDAKADAEWAKRLEASKLLEESTMRDRAATMRSENLNLPPAAPTASGIQGLINSQPNVVPQGVVKLPANRPEAVQSAQLPGSIAIGAALKKMRDATNQRDSQTDFADAYTGPNQPRPPVAPVARPPVARPPVAQPPVANVPPPPAAPSSPPVPTAAEAFAMANKTVPIEENEFLTKQKEAFEKANTLRNAQPAPGETALRALLDAQRERAALREKDEAGAGGRGLAALFQGMMGRNEGASVAAQDEREKQRRRLDITEALADKKEESVMRDIQAAQAAGNAEKEAAGWKDLAASKHEAQKTRAQVLGSVLGVSGNEIQAKGQLKVEELRSANHIEVEKLRNASAEKLAAISRAHAEAVHKMGNYEQNKVAELVNQIAGPGADPLKRLAATTQVLQVLHPEKFVNVENTETKRLKLALEAGKNWDAAHTADLARAMNNPTLKQQLAIDRQKAVEAGSGLEDSTSAKSLTKEQKEFEEKYNPKGQ